MSSATPSPDTSPLVTATGARDLDQSDEALIPAPMDAGRDPVGLDGVDESAWLDVIHRMDEVYSKLIADEVALEEKNAELEQSHQFIYSVLSSMSDLVVVCREDGTIEESNHAMRELVGEGALPLDGRLLADFMGSPDDVQQVRCMAAWADSTSGAGEREAIELRIRDAQGQLVPVEVQCTPRRDSAGVQVGYVLVGRPVGELRKAYQQLQDAHLALKSAQQQLVHSEKMASLGRLVAGVAHELNNPISFVLGNVHALGRYCQRLSDYVAAVDAQGPANAALKAVRQALKIDHVLKDMPSLIEGTTEGAQRTAEIVAGLKRFSAIDREEVKVVEVGPIIERAIHWVVKGTLPRFVVHWDATQSWWVRASPGHLLQVFMNLIQNAYDATLAAERVPPQLWIESAQQGSQLVLRFRDNGPGLTEDMRLRVFDPFFTTKPVGQGTGLGLSISYGLIEQHGGHLSVRNSDAGGAEFCVELPLAQP